MTETQTSTAQGLPMSDVLKKLKRPAGQRQDSTDAQVKDVLLLATALGMTEGVRLVTDHFKHELPAEPWSHAVGAAIEVVRAQGLKVTYTGDAHARSQMRALAIEMYCYDADDYFKLIFFGHPKYRSSY